MLGGRLLFSRLNGPSAFNHPSERHACVFFSQLADTLWSGPVLRSTERTCALITGQTQC